MVLVLLAAVLAIAATAASACREAPRGDAAVAAPASRCSPTSRSFRTLPRFRTSPLCVSEPRSSSGATDMVLLSPRRPQGRARGQNAAMIVSPRGRVLWYLPRRHRVFDLKTVIYRGRPHLAMYVRSGRRDGVYELRDQRYRVVRRIAFGAPYRTDMHELQLTEQGTAYIGSYHRLRVRGTGIVTEYVVRELDLETGRVLFEWHSLDHVPLSHSYHPQPRQGPWDYFHGNSIEPPAPGDPTVIVSARHTSAVYGIDRATGELRWTLGGKRDDFGLPGGSARFCAQHDARRLAGGDLTLFDNGGRGAANFGCRAHQARVLRFRLDHAPRRARLVSAFPSHRSSGAGEALLPVAFGNAQTLPNGNVLVGWGTSGMVSEVSPTGVPVFALNLPSASYRAISASWTGRPGGRPALAVRVRDGGGIEAWASWNGATEIARWCLLTGADPRRLRTARCVPFRDLETRVRSSRLARYAAVAAMDGGGAELGRSRVRRVP